MQFSGTNYNQITLSGATNFQSSTGTILFWMRSGGTLTASPAASEGAMIFTGGDGNDTDQYGISIVQDDSSNILAGTLSLTSHGAYNENFSTGVVVESTNLVSDDKWHLIALTYDQSTNGGLGLYIDGSLDSTNQNIFPTPPPTNVWTWPSGSAQEITLGLSHKTNWRPYNGALNDFRIYNRILKPSEISGVYATNSLVDTNALQEQLSFGSAPEAGFALRWTCGTNLQSTTNLPGPFTEIAPASSPWIIAPSHIQQFYRVGGLP